MLFFDLLDDTHEAASFLASIGRYQENSEEGAISSNLFSQVFLIPRPNSCFLDVS